MTDVESRDGAARTTRWALGGKELQTPSALYVDTPRAPAPTWAPVVLATTRPTADVAWVADRGSLFTPGDAPAGADLTIAPDLPYTAAGGQEILTAAVRENAARATVGEAVVVPGPATTDAGVAVLAGARALLDNPYAFTRHVTQVRSRLGFRPLLYAPGTGLPHEVALLAYAGIDLVDTVHLAVEARRGTYLTASGPVPAADLDPRDLPCACPACARGDLSRDGLYEHALHAQRVELAEVRTAIRRGRLRELVESRVRALPGLVSHLRRMDREGHDFFQVRTPVHRDAPLLATSREAIQRPEVERWRRRLETRYLKPEHARILLLLPCSARKPYSTSRTHRRLDKALQGVPNRAAVHEVILTSPLGLVPRELEGAYPAAHYDLPVTGDWEDTERALIRGAATALLARSGYDHILVHLDEVETEIVGPVLGNYTATCKGDPLSSESLASLREALDHVVRAVPRVGGKERAKADLESISRWQFGDAGEVLAHGATVRGRPPFQKLMDREGEQLAMRTDRGILALAPAGGRRLLDVGCHTVEIDDFRPKGTVFAVGVKAADPRIRIGDEVVLHHGGEFRGVGRALMCGPEMVDLTSGGAVATRHTAKKEGRE